MKPLITAKGKITQLRYELPHRVHDSKIYPIRAPNGSTIILYGHSHGIGVIWRGGCQLKHTTQSNKQASKASKVNGTNKEAVMIIDSDDDEPAQQMMLQPEFEEDGEELDPDHPYPSIIQQLSLSLNTQVLHIAIPKVPVVSTLRPADTIPLIFKTKIIVAAACADCTIRLITLPLNPPSDAMKQKRNAKSSCGETIVKLQGHQSIIRGLSMTWTSRKEAIIGEDQDDEMDIDDENVADSSTRRSPRQASRSHSQPLQDIGFDLLLASHSAELGGLLKIWRLQMTETGVKVAHPIAPYKTLNLSKPASHIAFNSAQYPKLRHSHLLITGASGIARIYDPLASHGRKSQGGCRQRESGAFISTFRATFESPKGKAYTPEILATRKAIIHAAWASDGHHVIALLSDGEWGVWDVDRSGPSPPADSSVFSLRGFVGTSEKAGTGGPPSPKRSSRSSLAPMTPNTRRRKEDNLFHGTSSSSSAAMRGGISVASSPSSPGAESEDSIIIWYGSEVYKVSDFAKFWARTASAAGGKSLPGPGLQTQDVNLFGENITSISQFDTSVKASRMAIARESLISGEHRLVITSSTNAALREDLNPLIAQERVEDEETRRTDEALLSRGELDLGGMDRMMDDMDGKGQVTRSLTLGGGPRKVLFASSAE